MNNFEEINRMFAEFMGAYKGNDSINMKNVYCGIPFKGTDTTCSLPVNLLEYHTSWDWLMPVYKKLNAHIILFETEDLKKQHERGLHLRHIKSCLVGGDIDDFYVSLELALKWYNREIKS